MLKTFFQNLHDDRSVLTSDLYDTVGGTGQAILMQLIRLNPMRVQKLE